MNELRTVTRLSEFGLEELITEAEAYGYLHIYSAEGRSPQSRYSATITFPTIAGTKLEARSDHFLPLRAALIQAIDRAEAIRSQFK